MSIQSTYLTDPVIGFAGQLSGGYDHTVRPAKNAEASASIPFGVAVSFKATPTSDIDAAFPSNGVAVTLAEVMGVVVQSHNHQPTVTLKDGTVAGDLDSTGLTTGALFDVLRKGEIIATCVDGCNPGDRLWIVKTNGTLRSTDPGSSLAIDATHCGQWLSTAIAGGLARLDVDFTGL